MHNTIYNKALTYPHMIMLTVLLLYQQPASLNDDFALIIGCWPCIDSLIKWQFV